MFVLIRPIWKLCPAVSESFPTVLLENTAISLPFELGCTFGSCILLLKCHGGVVCGDLMVDGIRSRSRRIEY